MEKVIILLCLVHVGLSDFLPLLPSTVEVTNSTVLLFVIRLIDGAVINCYFLNILLLLLDFIKHNIFY